MRLKRLPPALALSVSLALALTSTALASGSVVVSGDSPFAACTAGGETGRLYPNAEVEPQVTASGSLVVAAWQQDRWSDGGAHGLVSGASTDGGVTWSEFPQPFTVCAQPYYRTVAPYARASDPWVSIGPDGTVYANAITFNAGDRRNGVFAATSRDGLHWTNLRSLVEYTTNGGQFSTDKNSITADPVHAGVAYSVWDTLVTATDNPDDNPRTAAYNGDAYFSKTTDGGRTWSAPRVIFPTAQNNQTIGNVIVVDPRTGALYDFTAWIVHPNSAANTQYYAAFVKSTDGGATWSAPQRVARMFTVGVTDPNTGAVVRVGDGIPEPAIDPATGQLYVTWEESSAFKRGNTQGAVDDTVTVAASRDGGATWSLTTPVNTFTGLPAFTPVVRVNASGTVAVTYYDTRGLTPGNTTTLPTDYWITYSSDHGATFGGERHVFGPFNMLAAANARGFFVGDYEGLAARGASFIPVFGATNCADTSCSATGGATNPQDIYAATGF
jgi:hypothetical protein